MVKGFVSKGDLERSMYILRKYFEKGLEGSIKTLDLDNLQIHIEERMIHMENIVGHMKDNIVGRVVKILQNPKEKIHKGDDVGQGTHDDKNTTHVEQPSINKHAPRGFDSNMGSNQGWSPRGLQLPKIDMRKFDGKDPITWIFQMEQFFDIHQVPNIQKVTIAFLYLEPQQFVWYLLTVDCH